MITLNDICTLITDGSHYSPEDEGKGYPMLSVKDMCDDHFDTTDCKYIGEEAFQKLVDNGCRPQVNDVVVAKDGSFLKTAFTVKEAQDIALLSSIAILRPRLDIIVPDYLSYYLKSPSVYRTVSLNYISGTALKRIILKGLRRIPMEVPALVEQQHRVDLLNSIQSIITSRKKEIEKLDELIKARFVEMFGDPVANPMRWPVKRLKELSVQINSGNTPKGGSETYVEEGITFFRSQNVWKDHLEMEDIAYIDAETHTRMKRSSLKHGDILMTKTGRINTENSSLGRAALYDGEDDMANVNGHVYFIRLKGGVNNKFILRILVSPEYRDLIRSVCVGGIDKRQLNKEHIEDFPIICPPTDMVDDYVAFVEQVDKSKVV